MFQIVRGSSYSILSPFLLYVYLDDFSSVLDDCREGCRVGNKINRYLMYADGILFFSFLFANMVLIYLIYYRRALDSDELLISIVIVERFSL